MNFYRYLLCYIILFTTPMQGNNITVIGIGRLGLCTALVFEKAGYHVLGVDINPSYVDSLNKKIFSSPEPLVNEYLDQSKNFIATCSLDEGIQFSDLFYIMVDTPSTPAQEAYDHAKLSFVLSEINKRKVKDKHIVIGCTIFPGYIRNVGSFLIRDCTNCTLNYNPEFIAQGNIIYGLLNPDAVLIGEASKDAGDVLEAMYQRVCVNNPKICRMSPDSAEIAKLAVNCFITAKIAYANMIGDIADSTKNANKFDILGAVGADKRVGHLYLKPGYGFGGPCFPRDNRALGSYAQMIGIKPLILEATDNANKQHTQYMANKLLAEGKDTYIFEHVAYKENCKVPIIEESQKLIMAVYLAQMGKSVLIRDCAAIIEKVQQAYGNLFYYEVQDDEG